MRSKIQKRTDLEAYFKHETRRTSTFNISKRHINLRMHILEILDDKYGNVFLCLSVERLVNAALEQPLERNDMVTEMHCNNCMLQKARAYSGSLKSYTALETRLYIVAQNVQNLVFLQQLLNFSVKRLKS